MGRTPLERLRLGWVELQNVSAEEAPRAAAQLVGMGSRALRNTALILVARVGSRLLALVTVVLVLAHLQPEGFGRFQLVVNVSGLVTVILDLGFNTLYQREAARRPMEISRYLSNLVSVRLILALVALCVFASVLWLFGKAEFILPGFVMMVLSSYASLLRGTLYAVQRLGFEAVAIVLESLVLLGLVLYGVASDRGVGYFLWAYAATYGFSCAYFGVLISVRRLARIRWRLELDLIRHWFWGGLPFALAFVITTIYFRIDVPILDAIKGDVQVGWYGAAYKPFEALLFVPLSMLSVVFPVLAVYHRESPQRVAWAVSRFYKALLALGWPASVGTFVMVDAFRAVYRYPEAAPALRVLALGIVFMFVSSAFIGALNAIDRQVAFTWAALGSMVVNLVLNLVLIPQFGYLGASWATVLTEVALCILGWTLVARYLVPVPVPVLSWRILLAGALMGVALWPLQHVTGPPALAVVVGGAVVYGAALLALGGLDRQEKELVRRSLRLPGALAVPRVPWSRR